MQDNIFFNYAVQDDIFSDYEGDAWFHHNDKIIGKNLENDIPLPLINILNLKPLKK